jgi:hypothetical protein
MIKQGASWCDLVKHADARVEFVYLRGTTVICEDAQTGAKRWSMDAGQPLLYLRAAASDQGGRVCAIGQGQRDGLAWVVGPGVLLPFDVTHGVFPVAIQGFLTGWNLFIQRSPTSYERLTLDEHATVVDEHQFDMPSTSQGFLYVTAGGIPITQDRGRGAIPGLALPSPAPSDTRVWVGQSMTAATIALFDSETGQITPLNTPGGQPPHIVESGGTYHVCSYVDGGAWLSTHRRPFTVATPPVEPPPVNPPKEPDVSVRDVPNYAAELRAIADANPVAFRNAHGDYENQGRPGFLTEEQANEFIRIAAYELNRIDSRIGLNGKRATSTLSQDALCFRHDDGRESVIDCINGAGGSNPSIGWNVVGHYRIAGDGQRWIQPQRVSGGGSTPKPPTQPPVTPPPASGTFPAIAMPWDVQVAVLTKFIEGIWPRDRVPEVTETGVTGSGTLSRGALGFFIPVQLATIVAWVSANGNRAPVGMEWWALADRIAAEAIAAYRRDQPTP